MRYLLSFFTLSLIASFTRAAEPAPDFARDVRPILASACFKCHGPDEKTRKAKLRFDDRASAVASVIVPGDPAKSEFVRRLHLADDDAERMPPAATKITLTPQQKDILKRWVAAGAEYQAHWAFVAPRKSQIPSTKFQPPTKNPIDAFVLARLEKEGLKPSPRATKETLIRRASLDLIGLPPTPEEVDAFVKDETPEAYAKIVDRLLASPQYGERWARRWLDLARYADTNGYEKDRARSIWPYRDWVIRALNDDMPFDQFTIRQIAGDMLPNATQDDRIATGFHRNTMLNEEGGIDPLEFRFHAMTDRIATTGTAWLGLTLGCAQCHTHKFDPIAHREYYGLFAFLNNADEPEMPIQTAESNAKRAEMEAKIAALSKELPSKFPKGVDASAAFAEWLTQERAKAIRWRILRPTTAASNSPLLTVQADDSVFASGDFTKSDEYRLTFRGDFANVTAVRIEAIPDERLPKGGPGVTYYEGPFGDFTLCNIAATFDATASKFASTSHTFASGNFTTKAAIDTDPQTGWSVNGRQGERHVGVFVFDKPMSGKELSLKLLFERHFVAGLGRFRISVTSDAKPEARETPAEIETLLLKNNTTLTAAERSQLREQFHRTTPHLATARKEIDDLRKQLAQSPMTTLVMRERPPENPRPTFLHHRGEFLQPKDRIDVGLPAFLPPLPADAPKNRLGFARWLVSREHPLTARVAVNRQWAAFFGRGLVRTVEDFGYQGELPSHPELLDWLAVEFLESGWSMKKLHRLIVTSDTYQQSSRVTQELKDRDSENRLLARGPRGRLDAEIVRDAALKVAGLLSPKIGGPSVYPPQVPGVTTEGTYGAFAWKTSEGEDRHRRSLYTFAKRTAPFALYAAFDAPSGEACVARRDVSNTPVSALFTLNDPVFVEAAQALGKTFAAKPGTEEERLVQLFRRFTLRSPADREKAAIVAYYRDTKKSYTANPNDAKTIAGPGAGDAIERATWTVVARLLLNLDEFVTKN